MSQSFKRDWSGNYSESSGYSPSGSGSVSGTITKSGSSLQIIVSVRSSESVHTIDYQVKADGKFWKQGNIRNAQPIIFPLESWHSKNVTYTLHIVKMAYTRSVSGWVRGVWNDYIPLYFGYKGDLHIATYKDPGNPLKDQLDAANAQVQTLTQQIAQKDARIKQLEEQGIQDSEEIRRLKSEKETLQTQLDAANAQIASLTQQLSEANQTIQDQKNMITEQKKRIEELSTERDDLIVQVSELKKEGQTKDQLITQLETRINELDAEIKNLLENIEAMSSTAIDYIRTAYDDRMTDLKDAKARELEAIQENNQLKYTQALKDKNEASKVLVSLKNEYDTMTTDLRVFRARVKASSIAITQTDDVIKTLQQRLDTLTATPAPTQAPIQWGTSVYILIDANAWLNDGDLIVMAMNGTEVVTQPFQYRDPNQVFVISSQEHLRCMSKPGYFVTASDSCLVPRGTETPPEKNWRMRRISEGHSSQYSIMSEACGSFMVSAVDQVTLKRMPQSEGWFVIPVGRMQGPMVQTQAPVVTTPPPTTKPPSMNVGDLPTDPPANPLDLESYVGYELNTAKIYLTSRYEGVSVFDMDVTTFSTVDIQPKPNTVYLVWKSTRMMDGNAIVTKKIVQTVFGTVEKLETSDGPMSIPALPTVTPPVARLPEGAFAQYIGQSLTLVLQDIRQSYPGYTVRDARNDMQLTMDVNPQRITVLYMDVPSSDDGIVTRVVNG